MQLFSTASKGSKINFNFPKQLTYLTFPYIVNCDIGHSEGPSGAKKIVPFCLF